MVMTKEKRGEVIGKFHTHEGDTGSCEVQIALLSTRIDSLSKHFDDHVKDHAGRRGLLKMVSRRRKLLSYLRRRDAKRYKALIEGLGIRK